MKKCNHIKKIIKEYWGLLLILGFSPVIINYIVLMPSFLPVVGDSEKWLSFFGSFAGSVIMAGVTLYVLQKQLKQNHDENEENRDNNKSENESNRTLSYKLRLQDIELDWFGDLKASCMKLVSAFNNDDVTLVSDLDPFSEQFNEKVAQLLTRMNEAYFNFRLTIDYHENIAQKIEVQKLVRFTMEYLSLLADMNSLFVYGQILKEYLEGMDLSPDNLELKLKNIIIRNKKTMDIPEITENRVWDVLMNNDRFSKKECIEEVLSILRPRIKKFYIPDVRDAITKLLNAEYQKAKKVL